MKETLFRILILISVVGYVAYGILAYVWPFELSQDMQNLRAWNGYGAYIKPWSYFALGFEVLYITGHIGIYFYRNWARKLLVALLIINIIISPFTGVLVLLPLESFLGALMGIVFPSIVILSFLGEVKNKFKPSVPGKIETGVIF